MAEQPSFQHRVPKTVINVLTLEPGPRVRLVGDAVAEVVVNPQDGVWLFLRYVATPNNPDQVGTEEMVFAEDVLEPRAPPHLVGGEIARPHAHAATLHGKREDVAILA